MSRYDGPMTVLSTAWHLAQEYLTERLGASRGSPVAGAGVMARIQSTRRPASTSVSSGLGGMAMMPQVPMIPERIDGTMCDLAAASPLYQMEMALKDGPTTA